MGTQPRKGFERVPPRRFEDKNPPPLPEPEIASAVEAPSLEQCENLALALGFPILTEGLRPPYYLESMRNLHALIVRMLNGDEQATKAVETLKAAFGRV